MDHRMRRVVIVLAVCAGAVTVTAAQSAEQLDQRLHGHAGLPRAQTLADYDSGLAHHFAALDTRERLGDKAAIAVSLDDIGLIYHRIGELDRALSYFERALSLRREIGGDRPISDTLSNIGDVHHARKDYTRALDLHTESMHLRRKLGDRVGVASSLRNIGIAHTEMGNTSEARHHLNEALSMATAGGDRAVAAQAHLGLALLNREHGSSTTAIAHAQHALAIAGQERALELTRQAWEQLAASQEKAGDFAAALASFRQFQQVSDRIFSEDRARRVELLERRYQAERQGPEIAELKAEQAAAALRLTGEQSQRTAIMAGVAVFALLGLGLYRRRVESARIAERLSVTDSLTGLKNRRYVLQTIEADAFAAARKHRMAMASGSLPSDADLVFVLIDIDHFKAVNDQFGHDAGDKVLIQIADVLRSSCRATDTIARWGGEEFLVIFRFTNRETAAMSVERIRMAVEQRVFNIDGHRTLRRTCSIGFAPYPLIPERPEQVTWGEVIALADEALYSAKQSGRNSWAGTDPALHRAG
jgi:two-component system cell cycle response regulator